MVLILMLKNKYEHNRNQKKKDRKYKAFSWWVRLGYKQYIKNK